MERNAYLKLCQKASWKLGYAGAWWLVKWAKKDLVRRGDSLYVPYDYRFGFQNGEPRHLAMVRDVRANTEYTFLLEEIREGENEQKEL